MQAHNTYNTQNNTRKLSVIITVRFRPIALLDSAAVTVTEVRVTSTVEKFKMLEFYCYWYLRMANQIARLSSDVIVRRE